MNQRPGPTPPVWKHQDPATRATVPLPKLTRRRQLSHVLAEARWLIHTGCCCVIASGIVTMDTTSPTPLARAIGIALIITGSGTSGYHLHQKGRT
jgi:hypothetical protein